MCERPATINTPSSRNMTIDVAAQNTAISNKDIAKIKSSGNLFYTYHGRDSEVPLVHFLSEPINLPAGVTEDHGLSDGQGLI